MMFDSWISVKRKEWTRNASQIIFFKYISFGVTSSIVAFSFSWMSSTYGSKMVSKAGKLYDTPIETVLHVHILILLNIYFNHLIENAIMWKRVWLQVLLPDLFLFFVKWLRSSSLRIVCFPVRRLYKFILQVSESYYWMTSFKSYHGSRGSWLGS